MISSHLEVKTTKLIPFARSMWEQNEHGRWSGTRREDMMEDERSSHKSNNLESQTVSNHDNEKMERRKTRENFGCLV